MPVKTRGTKTSPGGLFSSQRLPLILLAMLSLYRMCIKPDKSFHLLCLIHESLDYFSKYFLFLIQLHSYVVKKKKRLPVVHAFSVIKKSPNIIDVNQEAVSQNFFSQTSSLHYSCCDLTPTSCFKQGISLGKTKLVKDRNGTHLLSYSDSTLCPPFGAQRQHDLPWWRTELLCNSQPLGK